MGGGETGKRKPERLGGEKLPGVFSRLPAAWGRVGGGVEGVVSEARTQT